MVAERNLLAWETFTEEMMRPRLAHPLRESRSRPRRPERRRTGAATVAAPQLARRAPLAAVAAVRTPDPEVARVRAAGGPIDRASYACVCGYMFNAPVSTTVHCPHCGAGQAW